MKAQMLYISVKKTSNQVQERAPKESKCYAATQPSYNGQKARSNNPEKSVKE